MVDVALLIGVVVALTQLAKHYVPTKYVPALSLLLGVVGGLIYVDGAMADRVLYGVMIGLSAAGLYDQTKITRK